jgi:hypothetical protein
MAQTRIVLAAEDKPLAEAIKDATGVGSISEVMSMLLRRYGKAFLDWWQSDPHQQCRYQSDKLPQSAASTLLAPVQPELAPAPSDSDEVSSTALTPMGELL